MVQGLSLSEMLTVTQTVVKFPYFTEPDSSLPCPQNLNTGPCPEPAQFVSHPISSSSVRPVANATDVLQPVGLLYSPYPPPACLDIPTFTTRYLHVHNDTRDPSSKRWNYVGEN